MTQDQATRYPIVLVPGFFGFVKLVVYPYWFGIVPALRRGGATVIPVMVSALNSSEIRGEQLLGRIEEILRETGAAKVNLIGHSQGAITIRYAAAKRPDLVASVTSVAGPNHGSELADYIESRFPIHTARGRLLNAALLVVGWAMHLLDTGYRGTRLPTDLDAAHLSLTTQGMASFNSQFPQGLPTTRLPTDLDAAHLSLTTQGMASFNSQFPQGLPTTWGGQGAELVNGVRYYSWSGTLQPGRTNRGWNRLDGTNVTCRIFASTFTKERGQSDGMVGRFSSHLGTVIGDDYPLDHFDIVNQSLGRVGKGANPVGLFLEHAARLKAAGL